MTESKIEYLALAWLFIVKYCLAEQEDWRIIYGILAIVSLFIWSN